MNAQASEILSLPAGEARRVGAGAGELTVLRGRIWLTERSPSHSVLRMRSRIGVDSTPNSSAASSNTRLEPASSEALIRGSIWYLQI